MMKEGRIFDSHDHLHSAKVRGKNIIKTGPDYVVSVHYLHNIYSVPVNKSILSIAEYRRRWRNDSFIKDERMKRYTPYMMQEMKRVQMVYNGYFNITKNVYLVYK